jgi:hypothetical protein
MLIKDGKSFMEAIQVFGKSRAQLDRDLHTYACSAVWLAVNNGRADWLNALHTQLNQSQRDYMRAWLSPYAKDPVFTAVKWLNFSTQKGGYVVVPGIDRKEAIPEDKIVAVEGDMRLFMLHQKVAKVAKDVQWTEALEGRVIALAKFLHKMVEEEGNPIPRSLVVAADGLADLAKAEMKRIKEEVIPEARLAVEAPIVDAPIVEAPAIKAETSKRRPSRAA